MLRLKDARILLDKKEYSGAYYICGYALECALKSCIAKKTKKNEFPDLAAVRASHTHNLEELIKAAELHTFFLASLNSNNDFKVNWNVIKDWDSIARYEFHGEKEARDLYKAITARNHGVLKWIKRYW